MQLSATSPEKFQNDDLSLDKLNAYMDYSELLADAEKYITDGFKLKNNPILAYHNLEHIRKVIFHVKEISAYYHLNEEDLFTVTAAAWFHDIGYLTGGPMQHECRSADIAEAFFKEKFVADKIINGIRNCITATTLPQQPTTLLEEIICDADLYHFGTEDFFCQDATMRKEAELRSGICIEKKAWILGTVKLLKSQKYHTKYCQELLSKNKELNINKLLSILEENEC